ncbi:hypothetical protein [Mycobacterium sp. ACS4331]|nr:hypothetical protein [Mycobacterium sp. ACS4331]
MSPASENPMFTLRFPHAGRAPEHGGPTAELSAAGANAAESA